MNQMMKILFGHKTSHGKYILMRFHTQTLQIIRICNFIRRRHSIVNKTTVSPSIFAHQNIIYHFRNDNYLICKHYTHSFPQLQHRFSRKPPFIPVIIRTMVSKNDFHSQQTRQGSQQCRTNSMDMHNIRMQTSCFQNRLERMNNGFQ